MILPAAIKAFRGRSLQDHSWIKDVPRSVLVDYINNLGVPPYFLTWPYKHQLASFILGTEMSTFLFLLDAGTGKTKLALDLLTWRYIRDEFKSALVMVPNVQSIAGWERNVARHSHLTVCPLYGTTEERWDTWQTVTDANLYVINYQGLVSMVSELLPSKRKNQDRQYRIDYRLVNAIAARFGAAIWDEIHYCGNVVSLVYRVSNRLSRLINIRYGLTGTPFGRNPIRLWPQFNLIDRGTTLGDTLGLFREALFEESENQRTGFSEWHLPQRNKAELNRWLRNRSITYEDKECNDLPQCVPIAVPFNLTPIQRKYYRQVIDGAVKSRGKSVPIKNSFVRLRQITSGFIGLPGDATSPKMELDLPDNPKLDLLETGLQEFPSEDKVVISCEFVPSLHKVVALLRKIKKETKARWTIGTLYGGSKDKTIWRRFQDDPNMKYFVIISVSGGTSIDLYAANRLIFYESPVRPDIRHQTEKRIDRTGQTKRTYIYDYIGQRSIDEKILEYNKEGRDLFRDLLVNPYDMLKELV